MQVALSSLKKGQSGTIVEINTKDENKKRHILDMGLVKGTKVKIKKVAPAGDPISIELRDYELCMSKKDLDEIFVTASLQL